MGMFDLSPNLAEVPLRWRVACDLVACTLTCVTMPSTTPPSGMHATAQQCDCALLRLPHCPAGLAARTKLPLVPGRVGLASVYPWHAGPRASFALPSFPAQAQAPAMRQYADPEPSHDADEVLLPKPALLRLALHYPPHPPPTRPLAVVMHLADATPPWNPVLVPMRPFFPPSNQPLFN